MLKILLGNEGLFLFFLLSSSFVVGISLFLIPLKSRGYYTWFYFLFTTGIYCSRIFYFIKLQNFSFSFIIGKSFQIPFFGNFLFQLNSLNI